MIWLIETPYLHDHVHTFDDSRSQKEKKTQRARLIRTTDDGVHDTSQKKKKKEKQKNAAADVLGWYAPPLSILIMRIEWLLC